MSPIPGKRPSRDSFTTDAAFTTYSFTAGAAVERVHIKMYLGENLRLAHGSGK